MAEKKNFTIENYNGTDYDTLYPETNSGQVLLDIDAQSSTSLSTGTTLDDALRHIFQNDGIFHIGDTLTTARTNLGNRWLLCNGTMVNSADYPALSQFFNSVTFNYSKVAEYTKPSNFYSTRTHSFDVMYDESTGKYGILMYIHYLTSSTGLSDKILAYQTIGDSSWVDCTGDGINNALISNTFVKLLNRNFVVCNTQTYNTTSNSNPMGYYCTGAPTSSASFSPIALPTVDVDWRWVDAAYYNGKYYFTITGSSTAPSYLLVYDDLASVPQSVLLKDSGGVGKFSIVNGKLCVCTGSSSNNATFKLINEDGTLGIITITTEDSYDSTTDLMLYSLGQNYVLTRLYNRSSSFYTFYVYFSDSLNNSFTRNTSYSNEQDVLQKDDMLILSNGYYIDMELNIKTQDNFQIIGDNPARPLRNCNNNTFVVGGTYNVYQSSLDTKFQLPTYSPATGLYAYIKAKD